MKHKPARLPLLLTFVRGAIGKEYVIKHYHYGIIRTKYPDMTRIVASTGQRNCRYLFKEAVKQAQQVMADPVQKAAWLKKVRQRHRLFNQLVKHFMLAGKKAAKKRQTIGAYLVQGCFKAGNNDIVKNEAMDPLPKVSPVAGPGIIYCSHHSFAGTGLLLAAPGQAIRFSLTCC